MRLRPAADQRVVDQEPDLELVRPAGHRADPAVLGAEGLAQPVRHLGPVLDHLPGQHPHPHPIQIRVDCTVAASGAYWVPSPDAVQPGDVHRGRPLVPVERQPPPPRPQRQPDPAARTTPASGAGSQPAPPASSRKPATAQQRMPGQLARPPTSPSATVSVITATGEPDDDQQQPAPPVFSSQPRISAQQREPHRLPPDPDRVAAGTRRPTNDVIMA